MDKSTYIAIDLKSFYASVECIERGLDPMNTNLVVADRERSAKTICLAVSPTMKAYGIPGRPRLFEVDQKIRDINTERRFRAPKHTLFGTSYYANELKQSPSLAVDFITAVPRMALYIQYSTRIYEVYLKYIAPEDIHVYSIDEVMIDVTSYLHTYGMTARELASKMIRDVYETVGMTATAGIGTNLYLAKVAMDIMAKRIPADENGVCIAELDELTYRKELWNHRPLIDFWRVGKGYAKKLEEKGLYTMGDIAKCSVGDEKSYYNEDLLYKLFGVNAELLIDHAWGWEPCTIADIKAYKPENTSVGSGQVLHSAYSCEKARMVVHEMIDLLVLDLVSKGLVTNQLVLTVGYDIENLSDGKRAKSYKGEVTIDRYGRATPKHAHGTENLESYTSSTKTIVEAMLRLYDRIVDPTLSVRRINMSANHVIVERDIPQKTIHEQLDLFVDYDALEIQKKESEEELAKEKRMQQAMISIKEKYGKNAILKGMNLEDGATARDKNAQIGGHKA